MQPVPIVRDANRALDGDAVAAVYCRSWRAAFGHVLGQAQVSDAALTERGMALLSSPLWEQNSAAHALYGRLGWVDSGTRRTAEVGAVWFDYQRWVHRVAVPTPLG